jgi:Fe-Mn family superoxide dismutase
MNSKKLNKIIRNSLGFDDKKILDESIAASSKPFNLNTELLTAETKNTHLQLYKSYVEALNSVSAKLDVADRANANNLNSEFRNLKINETYNLNAVYLHELYLANISDVNSELTMDSLTYMRLQRDFGTFDDWQKDFIATCLVSKNGWACTVYSTFLQRYINVAVDLHDQNVLFGLYPVIVIDMWEHAYFKDYLNNKKAYVTNMMREIDWQIIENRFKRSDGIAKALE